MNSKPLSGIRVLDLSRLLPAPYCTMMLADLGAEVLKIEEPKGGDYTRTLSAELFALVNRNKRGMTLDLRKPEGQAVLKRLVRDADVLMESFRPGVMAGMGLDYDTLKAENPKLVYCSLTGYGQDGPYRDKAGHDMNYLGYAGVLEQIGPAGHGPVVPNVQIADLAGGGLTAAVGILAAVIKARSTDEGSFVDISMLDGSMALQVMALATYRTMGKTQARGEDMLTGGLPSYDIYECKDGKHIALGALEPKFWAGFCAAVGRSDLVAKQFSRGEAHAALKAEVVGLFKTRTRDEWAAALEEHDCCASPILGLEEAFSDPQVRARGMVIKSGGKPQFATPVRINNDTFVIERQAPRLGEHTANVLESAGYTPEQIQSLKQAGVI